MSALDELNRLLPPPARPNDNSGDWLVAETSIGLRFPEDYKQFIASYGTVKICNYLWVYNPFAQVSDKGSFRGLLLDLLASFHEAPHGVEHIPYHLYPEAGGLLPVIGTDNGDIISWITDGEPNTWKLFAWFYPGRDSLTLDSTLTQCFFDLVNLSSPLLPDHIPEDFFQPENRRLIVT